MSRTQRTSLITIVVVTLFVVTPVYLRRNQASELLNPNSSPVAVSDNYTVHGSATISPMQNDYDPDSGDHVNWNGLVTNVQHGTLSTLPPNFLYTPSTGYVGSDGFTYSICDTHSACVTGTVSITVVNQPPIANPDFYTVHGGLQVSPKQNDTDPDGDSLTVVGIATYPQHGNLQPVGAGVYSYVAASGYVGPDSFTYTIKDSPGLTATATVTLNVVNQLVANPDVYFVHSPLTFNPKANDVDPDGDSFTYLATATLPTHGSLFGLGNDQWSYSPNAGYIGRDSYTYTIRDSLGLVSTGTVFLFVYNPSTAKSPWSCACPGDPNKNSYYDAKLGGLRYVSTGQPVGPSAGDPVNLATGREAEMPAPDLTIYNPSGPGVTWQRNYISEQALAETTGYGSPGFSRGWVHNYDVRIQGVSGSWGAVKLYYPNGASETLTPQLSGGVPTGAFTTTAGVPYFVTGVSGSPTGTWQSITVTWTDQTQWKFTLLSGTTYVLSQITNRTGQSINLNWNSNRALTQITDAGTSTVLLTFAYDTKGRIQTATDIYNRQISYSFSTATSTTQSNLQTVSQVVSSGTPNPPAHWTYGYSTDDGLQLNSVTVPSPTGSGNSTATINYDSQGRVASLVDANGNQRIYTYNSGTTQVQVKDSANNVALSWTQKFNTSGLNTGTTDAASHSTTIAYADSANPLKPTSVTDRNGHVTSYTYDSFGNVLTVITPRNVTTTYTWSYANFSLGRLTSIQEGTKPATTITYYEPSGLVNTVTRPEPNNGAGTTTTIYTYDSLGNILTIVTPGNNATSSITTTFNYTSDGGYSQAAKIGQPLTVTDNLTHVTHLRYDSQGRTTSVTDAIGNETDFSYNLIGQPVTTTYPATGQTGTGHSHTTNAYLYVGGPLTSTTFFDESNSQVRQVTRSYGLEGESLAVGGSTEPVTNTYDALYRLKTLKDGNNNTTTYAYNNIGLPSSITMPGGEVTQFPSYDNAGNLLQRIDGNNVTTNYVYNDAESLLTDIQYPATTNLNVHFTYDGYGRRSGMTDGTGGQSYSYGNLDELLSNTTTYTGLSAKTISYSYYPNGSRQSMTTPAGTFAYSYDSAGRPTSMTNPFSETTSWSYKNNNWLETQTLANGATATYTYNSVGQVTRLLNQISATTISDFSGIAYDGIGNRTSVAASIPGAPSLSGTTSYMYDSKNQLMQESSTRNGGFTDDFSYDSAGNPTSFKGTTKSYNSNNQRTGADFVYDGNGNPTNYQGTDLTFDPENRLTTFGSSLTAAYNGAGLRAWKDNTSVRTYFIYDGVLPIIEMDSGGNVLATTSLGTTGVESRRTGTSSVFYSFDAEGNMVQNSDSSGVVLSNDLFSAHGISLAGFLSGPFGYKAQFGYYTDSETSLQLLTNRYYDSNEGRFLTRDPISYSGGTNLYAYTSNNPVNTIDPSGLQREDAKWQPGEIEAAAEMRRKMATWSTPQGNCGCESFHMNPTKALSATGNFVRAGAGYASGSLNMAAGMGLTDTGVGSPGGVPLFAWGTWQVRGAYAAQARGFQQWDESFKEDWGDANFKNFYGQLPYGTSYDDLCEPGLKEFWTDYTYQQSAPARNLWQKFKDASADLASNIVNLYGG